MNSLRLPTGIPIVAAERFDALSFTGYVKNTGRAYQRQAIELVNVCRIFAETSLQGGRHLAMFKLTMSTAEETLRSAAEAGKTVTDKTSKAFQDAEEKLLQYRATIHPRSQEMDAMITERMARAREKDEQSLRLFNQLRERRRSNAACSHTANVPSERLSAPSAFPPPSMPFLMHVRVEGGQLLSTVHGDTQGSPQALTHQELLASNPPKLPTPDSCPTAAAAPVLQVSAPLRSPETPTHRPSSIAVPSAIPQPSSEFIDPRGVPPTVAHEPPGNVSLRSSDSPSHFPVSSTPRSPSLSTCGEPPSGPIDVAPMTHPGCRNGTIQPSHVQPTIPSNLLPRSGEKKMPPKQSQNNYNRPTRGRSAPKPSAKFTPATILPSTTKTRRSIYVMPGAYPEVSVDVDISSWVLVGPVSPLAEISKTGWITRLLAVLG